MTRTRFSAEALVVLKDVFACDQTPSARTRQELAASMDVTPRAVQVWFQNQRQRQKAAQMHAAHTLSFGAHFGGVPMSRSLSSDRAISAELLTQLRTPHGGLPTVGETPTQGQMMHADAEAHAYPPPTMLPFHPQAFYGQYCNSFSPASTSPPTAPVSPAQAAPPQPAVQPPAIGRVDSLADLAEVAGLSKVLDKNNSIYDLASLSRNGSLADLASLSRSGSLKDLASLTRNASLKDLAAAVREGGLSYNVPREEAAGGSVSTVAA